MNPLNLSDVTQYVEQNIGDFHKRRVLSLEGLALIDVLKNKNPYLFKAKNLLTAEMVVRQITDAHLSSHEETILGGWLEGLAIFINNNVYGGRKSGIKGIDLEFDLNGVRYIVDIKSGPKWANKGGLDNMKENFTKAKKTLRTSNSNINVVAVNGCCYGRDNKPDKGEYFKYCGQRFWTFISGDEYLYLNLIEPLGHKAKARNDEFLELYAHVINKFTIEFSDTFVDSGGAINWKKIVELNSSVAPLPRKKPVRKV